MLKFIVVHGWLLKLQYLSGNTYNSVQLFCVDSFYSSVKQRYLKKMWSKVRANEKREWVSEHMRERSAHMEQFGFCKGIMEVVCLWRWMPIGSTLLVESMGKSPTPHLYPQFLKKFLAKHREVDWRETMDIQQWLRGHWVQYLWNHWEHWLTVH